MKSTSHENRCQQNSKNIQFFHRTTTSDVRHSNTLEDLDDQDIFKSVVEPSKDKFNSYEISKTPAVAAPAPLQELLLLM